MQFLLHIDGFIIFESVWLFNKIYGFEGVNPKLRLMFGFITLIWTHIEDSFLPFYKIVRFIQLIFDKKLWCLKKVTFTNIHEWQEPCVISLKISVKDNVTKLNIRLVKIKTCIFSNTRNWIIHAYFLLVFCGFAIFVKT